MIAADPESRIPTRRIAAGHRSISWSHSMMHRVVHWHRLRTVHTPGEKTREGETSNQKISRLVPFEIRTGRLPVGWKPVARGRGYFTPASVPRLAEVSPKPVPGFDVGQNTPEWKTSQALFGDILLRPSRFWMAVFVAYDKKLANMSPWLYLVG